MRFGAPALDSNLISIPVAEGGELLCFLTPALNYVEYQGGIFLENGGARP